MGQVYSGLVIGGPLDGKRVDHYASVYAIPLHPPLRVSVRSADDVLPSRETIRVIHYHHFRIAAERWAWVPGEVLHRQEFEHRIWDHPMEYVLEKLMRGYRPEGY